LVVIRDGAHNHAYPEWFGNDHDCSNIHAVLQCCISCRSDSVSLDRTRRMVHRTMIKRLSIALWAALAAFFVGCAPALAQWQTPDHSVPVGRGSGVGFKFATPGTSGLPLTSAGTSSDPAFGQIGLNGLPSIASNTVLANVTGGTATPTAQ